MRYVVYGVLFVVAFDVFVLGLRWLGLWLGERRERREWAQYMRNRYG